MFSGWSPQYNINQDNEAIYQKRKKVQIKPFLPPITKRRYQKQQNNSKDITFRNKENISNNKQKQYSVRELLPLKEFKFAQRDKKKNKNKFVDVYNELRSLGVSYSLKQMAQANKQVNKKKNYNLLLKLLEK